MEGRPYPRLLLLDYLSPEERKALGYVEMTAEEKKQQEQREKEAKMQAEMNEKMMRTIEVDDKGKSAEKVAVVSEQVPE